MYSSNNSSDLTTEEPFINLQKASNLIKCHINNSGNINQAIKIVECVKNKIENKRNEKTPLKTYTIIDMLLLAMCERLYSVCVRYSINILHGLAHSIHALHMYSDLLETNSIKSQSRSILSKIREEFSESILQTSNYYLLCGDRRRTHYYFKQYLLSLPKNKDLPLQYPSRICDFIQWFLTKSSILIKSHKTTDASDLLNIAIKRYSSDEYKNDSDNHLPILIELIRGDVLRLLKNKNITTDTNEVECYLKVMKHLDNLISKEERNEYLNFNNNFNNDDDSVSNEHIASVRLYSTCLCKIGDLKVMNNSEFKDIDFEQIIKYCLTTDDKSELAMSYMNLASYLIMQCKDIDHLAWTNLDIDSQIKSKLPLKYLQSLEYFEKAFELAYDSKNPSLLRLISLTYVQYIGLINTNKSLYLIHNSIGNTIRNQSALSFLEKIRILSKERDKNKKSNRNINIDKLNNLYNLHSCLYYNDFNTYIKKLPSVWSYVSISITNDKNKNNEKLLICSQFNGGDDNHIVILKKHLPKIYNDDTKDILDIIFNRFSSVMNINNQTLSISKTKNNETSSSSSKEKDLKKQWWNERKKADNELKSLLECIETELLGSYCGIFMGNFIDEDIVKKFNIHLEEIWNEIISIKTTYDEEYCKTCSNCVSEFDSDSNRKNNNSLLSKDTLSIIFKSAMIYSSYYSHDIGSKHLTHFLMSVTLDCSGNRKRKTAKNNRKLVKKKVIYICHLILKKAEYFIDANPKNSIHHQHPLFLFLDKEIDKLPLESMNVMSDSPVCRVPSISFLFQSKFFLQPKNISRNQVSFIINPNNDLPNTEQRMNKLLEKDCFKSWKGQIGNTPSKETFKEILINSDVFLYCGHSGGQQFYSPDSIEKLNIHTIPLLMGCSSIRLAHIGDFEPYGLAFSYLLGGSPAVLGTLWDVSDYDIDRFSIDFIESGFGFEDCPIGKTLIDNMSSARKACKLRYLVGAAPVYYGIPIGIKS